MECESHATGKTGEGVMLLDIGVFTGRFHPLIVHLPIGFLLLAVFFALLSRKEKYRSLQPAVPLGLLAGCISAAFASVTGYILSQSGDYDPEVLDDHLWAGLLTTALSFFAYLISIKKIPLRIFTNTKSFVVLLLILFVFISLTGHLGGSLTHGADYISTSVLWDTKRQKQKVTDINQAALFADLVHPILEEKCGSCHNGSKKKGKLSVGSFEAILKGGKHGPAIKPGDVAGSEVVKRISLDPSDKKFMPTDGKTPLTKEETALIKWWIEKAAITGDKTFIATNPPEEIKKFAAGYLGTGVGETGSSMAVNMVAAPVNESLVKKLTDTGFVIKYLHFKPDLLDITLPAGTPGASEKIRLLLPLKENVRWLSVAGNQLTDDDLSVINQFSNLERLRLDNNPVTDKGIAKLDSLAALVSINLYNTKISKDCFASLQKLASLKRAYVWGTSIKKEDAVALASKIDVVMADKQPPVK
ncbi:MAG TPA: c-type cytochrome domain-containing protein [Flavisolibacter sp.]|nr:c-type cytochrome domain-containing protein [Flavisolibacter sp.]